MWVLQWLHSETVGYFRQISVASYCVPLNPKPNVPDKTQGYTDIRQLATDKERVWLCVVRQSVGTLRRVVSLLSVRVFVVRTCDVLKSGSLRV